MNNTFYNHYDQERLEPQDTSADHRTPYQIDRDRVLYTPSFRQLQSKTQVFLSGEYDFYRTRLTHSLEVAQIGRSITHWLRASSPLLSDTFFIDPDLVEAACISHDLGHPPFGHAGEKVLNHLMREHGGFEGNAQTLRLLTERILPERRTGMNPTRAFVDSVLKYKTLWSELGGAASPPVNHFLYNHQHTYLDWVMDGNDFPPELSPGPIRDNYKSLECQIMDWADDTAYSLNDLADSARAGFLTADNARSWAEQNVHSPVEERAMDSLIRALRSRNLDAFVGKRIGSYIRATDLTEDVSLLSGTSNRYRYRLTVDPYVAEACNLYKKLSYELVFQRTSLRQLEYKRKVMLERLWTALCETSLEPSAYQLLPDGEQAALNACATTGEKHRLLADYIASLTDLSTKQLYLRLYDGNHGSITDLLT